MKASQTGIKRILNAVKYSYNGFVAVFKSEAAFRQELFLCSVGVVILFFLPVYGISLALMVFSLFFILMAELINTGIETIIDRIGAEYHPLSQKAKDIGSLLVLLSFLNMILIWSIVLCSIF